MKTRLTIFLLLTFSLFFGQNLSGQNGYDLEQYKYPLKTITTHCQDEPDSAISTSCLLYDTSYRLVRLLTHGRYNSRVRDFTYNNIGLLASCHSYNLPDSSQYDRTRVFKYDDKGQLIYEGFDDDRPNNSKNSYSYNKKGQLVSTTEECNYTHWEFSFDYDSKGRIIKKHKLRDVDEIVVYEYSGNNLTKEILATPNRTVETTYQYDSSGLCLIQKENGKVIQENNYSNGRLVKRLTYAHGGDPGVYPCKMNYIIKYEYY